jgi:hypothetical protein
MAYPRVFPGLFRRLRAHFFKKPSQAVRGSSENPLQALSNESRRWRMGLDREFIDDVAAEVVLQLVVDGDIVVSPVSVAVLELEMATVIFQFQALHRLETGARRRATHENAPTCVPAPGPRTSLSLVAEMIRALRSSRSVARVVADDAALVRKILSVVALLLARRGSPQPVGGMGSPPPGTGSVPPSGCPAEVRAWEVRLGETPREPDPERRERGKKRWKR